MFSHAPVSEDFRKAMLKPVAASRASSPTGSVTSNKEKPPGKAKGKGRGYCYAWLSTGKCERESCSFAHLNQKEVDKLLAAAPAQEIGSHCMQQPLPRSGNRVLSTLLPGTPAISMSMTEVSNCEETYGYTGELDKD